MGMIRLFSLLMGLLLCGSATAQSEPTQVKVGVMITSISGIDSSDGSFDISAYAWFSDPLGLFDPEKHLQIYARDARFKTVERLPLNGGGEFTAVEIHATVDQLFDNRNYPFDRQTLRLGFETQYNSHQLVLKGDPDDLGLADFATINGWDVEVCSKS